MKGYNYAPSGADSYKIQRMPWLFLTNVVSHWISFMSGIVSLAVSFYLWASNKQKAIWLTFTLGIIFLFWACGNAWRDEHRNSETLKVEKATAVSLQDTYRQNATLEQALYAGSQNVVSAQIKALDEQRAQLDECQGAINSQQGTISSCVVSLGKMNPVIRQKISVVMDPFATMDARGRLDPSGALAKRQITELFVITNVEERNFKGVLECSQSFNILKGPFINSESTVVITGTPAPIARSDRSYELRVEQSSTVWNPSHPAFLRVVSDPPNPGKCRFTQTE